MASIKVKFRPSAIAGHMGSVYYQVIHERKVRQLPTDFHIYDNEWNERRSCITAPAETTRREILIRISRGIHKDIERLTRIINRFDNTLLAYTPDEVIESFTDYLNQCSLLNFSGDIIARMRLNGKIRTSETYVAAINSFKRFRGGRDILLDEFTTELMEEYQSYLKSRNLTPNTISFYMRILRAIYNKAADKEIFPRENPFRHVYTGIDKTVKRAIPLRAIRKIKSLDLSTRPSVDLARDIFLLSFYFRGMSVIDMAFLRKKDLKNGYLSYRRRKTGKLLIIKWTPDMQKIIDKYPQNKTDYLLPIIRNDSVNLRYAYRNMAYNINRNLKKIAEMVGISTQLTLYVARHSWASVARNKGISLSIISEGMGHDSELTTRIYLSSLDTSTIDRANAKIISLL